MIVFVRLRRYLAGLSFHRIILWCYAIWYLVNVYHHFDAQPRLWIISLALSMIIGVALILSATAARPGVTRLDRWHVMRLFLMPFCVSSFTGLVKDAGYILIFPPSLKENLIGIAVIGGFLAVVWLVKSGSADVVSPVAAKPVP
jgi:hypothetical protein